MQTALQTATLTINEPRLLYTTLTVTAESCAEIALHTPPGGGATCYALLLDGEYHDLVLWRYAVDAPESVQALNRVLVQVQAAIGRLQVC